MWRKKTLQKVRVQKVRGNMMCEKWSWFNIGSNICCVFCFGNFNPPKNKTALSNQNKESFGFQGWWLMRGLRSRSGKPKLWSAVSPHAMTSIGIRIFFLHFKELISQERIWYLAYTVHIHIYIWCTYITVYHTYFPYLVCVLPHLLVIIVLLFGSEAEYTLIF